MFETLNVDIILFVTVSLSRFMIYLMAIRKVLALADRKEMLD
jgi:hypothetical protein